VDPLTHTFTGGSLAAAGPRRATPLALPTLVLAVNAPDVDVLSLAWGPWASLAWRRGVTHGIAALLVLPFLVAGAVLLWDRLVRRRRRPGAAPARPVALLGLAALGVWTHPVLDWVNTYGMRWLHPLDGRWSYGDSIFIVDPWLWLLLGGPSFLAWSRSRPSLAGWGALALVLSLPIVLVDAVPAGARLAWFGGIAGWIFLRWRLPARPDGAARASLVLACGYLLVMVAQTPLAERVVLAEAAADPRIGPPTDVMVGPLPADPLGGQVVLETEEAYWSGTFRWGPAPRVEWQAVPFLRAGRDRTIEAAESHPDARRWLVWARFPFHHVEERDHGWEVIIRDARYPGMGGSLAGIRIRLDPELEPMGAAEAHRVP
jgi:inner membrane protein